MQPRWFTTVHRNPNTSEIMPDDECDTLAETLCRPATKFARIIRNGVLLAKAIKAPKCTAWIEPKYKFATRFEGLVWELTPEGKLFAWEATPTI